MIHKDISRFPLADVSELPDEDLPWAIVMRPPGTGTGSGGMSKTIHYNQGDTVIGFFLDGDNAQQPIIMGALGNSKYAAKNGEVVPFGNFTGYNKVMESPSAKVRTQSESSDIQEQPSPQTNTPERTVNSCLLYTSPSPRDLSTSRMPSSA